MPRNRLAGGLIRMGGGAGIRFERTRPRAWPRVGVAHFGRSWSSNLQPPRLVASITLKQLLVVVLVLSVLGSILVASLASGQRRAAEARAALAMEQVFSAEGVWRQVDADRNGGQDYWTRDVAGLFGVTDSANQPLRYIDGRLAAADVAPAANYRGVSAPASGTGHRVRAMLVDETGSPYVDSSLSPATAAPVAGLRCTNTCKFAFCAWLDGGLGRPPAQFIVNEEGVVYRADPSALIPMTTWPAVDPPGTACE